MYVIIYKYTDKLPKGLINKRFYTKIHAEKYAGTAKERYSNIKDTAIEEDVQVEGDHKLWTIDQIFKIYGLFPTPENEPKFFFNNEFDRLYDMPFPKLHDYYKKILILSTKPWDYTMHKAL